MKKYFLVFLLLIGIYHISLNAQNNIFINKYSQGTGIGNPCSPLSEWIELAIVGTENSDLQGYYVTDDLPNDEILFRFSQNPIWKSVSPGTIIVIYNGKSNLNCRKDIDFEDTTVTDCNYTIVVGTHQSRYFTDVNWSELNAFANSNNQDNPKLYDKGGNLIHDWDQNNNIAFTDIYPKGGEAVLFNGENAFDVTKSQYWQTMPADSIKPGKDISHWILNLRRPALSIPAFQTSERCGAGSMNLSLFFGEIPGTGFQIYSGAECSADSSFILTGDSAVFHLPYISESGALFSVQVFLENTECKSLCQEIFLKPSVIPMAPLVENLHFCGGRPLTFTVISPDSISKVLLYDSQSSTNAITEDSVMPYHLTINDIVSQSTTYYVESQLGECVSDRMLVYAEIFPVPEKTEISQIPKISLNSAWISWHPQIGTSTYELLLYNDSMNQSFYTVDTFYLFDNLLPATGYFVQIRSICSDTSSKWSEPFYIVTQTNGISKELKKSNIRFIRSFENSELSIIVENSIANQWNFDIFDIYGRRIFTQFLENTVNPLYKFEEFSNYESGIYVIQISNNAKEVIRKIIVKH